MTVVSSKEFATNQDKYFDLALDEQVCIQKGNNMFLLIYKNVNNAGDMNIYHDASIYDRVLEPDDDFRRAITMDELRRRVKENIHQWYSERNECNSITGGTAVS
jgi:hypothetical protein